jgi:hypothetical protein
MKVAAVAFVLIVVVGAGLAIHHFGLEPPEPPIAATGPSVSRAGDGAGEPRPTLVAATTAATNAPVMSLAAARELALARITANNDRYRGQSVEVAHLKARFEGMPQGTRAETDARLDAQGQYLVQKVKLDALRTELVEADADVRAATRAEEARQAADERRRAADVEAHRQAIALPLAGGAVGVLPRFTVVRVIDPSRMEISVRGDRVLLEGTSTFALAPGQPFLYDQPVVVRAAGVAGEGARWVATPYVPR